MAIVHPYITFNGNCREAMEFYRQCLGGKLYFQTLEASPLAEKMPPKMKRYLIHATLKNRTLVLLGTDMTGGKGLLRGNGISLVLNCNSENEIKGYYKKLSEGAVKTRRIRRTAGGALFGTLTDKFGQHWLLNYNG